MPRHIPAPVPMKKLALSSITGRDPTNPPPRPSSGLELHKRAKLSSITARTPDPINMTAVETKEDSLIAGRLVSYKLDYPEDYEEYRKESLDPQSRWYSRSKARRLNLSYELPYQTETHNDQARYLAHVLVHLYIAIKSLDLEGYVRISTKDLGAVKNDIELALETDFFGADMSFDLEDEEYGDDEDDEVKSSGVIGKVLPRSATVISVNHWTNELKSCLKMKFDIPMSLRASLAKVFYYLCLSRGQSIQLSVFAGMFLRLTTKFEEQLAEHNLLELDHTQLLNFLTQFYPDPDPTFDIYNAQNNESDKQTLNLLLKVALHASNFFVFEAMNDVFDWTLQRFHLSTIYLSLPILANTLPIHFNEKGTAMDYVNSIFHLWTNLANSKARLDSNVFYLLSRISTKSYSLLSKNRISVDTLEQFGILNSMQLDVVLNRIQNNLRSDFHDQSYSKVAILLITSITPVNFDGFFAKLKTLLDSLETYVHPSNMGSWSSWISKFCHRFISTYHKRILAERKDDCELPEALKLTEKMNTKIVEAFSDLVLLGSQSKKDSISNYYVSAIGYLADFPSTLKTQFMDKILLDVYDALTDQFVNSSHRIIVSLKQFTEVSRFMVYDPIYKNHVVQLLTLMVNKIGTNDIDLNNHVVNTFVTLVSIIPIQVIATEDDFVSFESTTVNFIQEHLQFIKLNPGVPYRPGEREVTSAFKASTLAFPDLITLFTERLFLLLEADLSEKFNFKITQSVLIFTESLSDDLFELMAGIIHNKLLEGEFQNTSHNTPIFANITAAMVKRDNSLAGKFFMDLDILIRFEIEQGAGSVRNTNTDKPLDADKKLELYLVVLSEVISVANGEAVSFYKQILDLIMHLHDKITNPSLDNTISYVIHKTLKNFTNVKLKENRLLREMPTAEEYSASWGANQFDDKRFERENLDFEWYVPTIKEIHCAIEIFEAVVLTTLTKIDAIIARDVESGLLHVDELSKNLASIGTSMSGLSFLFDPDFNNSVDEHSNLSTSLTQRLLILRSLRASRIDSHELNIDIEQITNNNDDPEVLPEAEIPDCNAGALEDLAMHNGIDHSILASEDGAGSSRMMSPADGRESAFNSVMNPSISFRHGKVYSCNYFFGSTAAEKKISFDYNHIHSLRSLIGQGLHKMFIYLSEKSTGNIHLFEVLLTVLRTYFSDVGKESSFDLDDQLFIDYSFLKKVQSVGNYKKPFTRTCLGARVEKYNRQRVVLHSTNRLPSKLDKVLMGDLMQLATSAYENTSAAAYGTLIHTMRKIIGSYGIILKSLLTQADKFIEENEPKRLESTLKMFLLAKISNKITGDYTNLKAVITMLDKCLKHESHEVSNIARSLLIATSGTVKVPSAVALFNETEIDSAIRPPDKCIDLEISAVRTAKDKKRVEYITLLEELEVFILSLIKDGSHWQQKFGYLNFLSTLEEYYELKTTPEVLKLLVSESKGHPSLVRHCLKWFSKLVDKVMHFATFGHSLENSFQLGFLRPGLIEVDTSSNFSKTFESEMQNFTDPSFYYDGRMYTGWLFWGRKFAALSNQKSFEYITLSDDDKALLAEFGSVVDKEWLSDVLKSVTVDNESKAMFQVSDISLIISVIQLSELGFTVIKYKDILEILDEIWDKDDKAAVILSAEIVCGLFAATNHTRKENIELRDSYLDDFLDRALVSDLTPDSAGVWSIICWWLPVRLDFRRVPLFHKKLLMLNSMMDTASDQAFVQSSRLLFARSYISNIGWQFQGAEDVLQSLTFVHPYRAVRYQIGGLLSVLSFSVFQESFADVGDFLENQKGQQLGKLAFKLPDSFDKRIKQWFAETESKRTKVDSMSAQEAMYSDYHYLTSTILAWLAGCKMSPFVHELVPYLKDYFFPMLMNLDSYRDLCKLAQVNLEPVFQDFAKRIDYRPEELGDLIDVSTHPYDSVHQLRQQLAFIESFFSHQLLLLTPEQKLHLLSRVDELLFHSSVEVRAKAGSVLTGIIHNTKDLEIVTNFKEKYKKILSKRVKKDVANGKLIQLHGAAIGVGAMVSAFPYTSPPPSWMPDQIVLLARASAYPGLIGKSAKDSLSNFKKLRADTWHIDRDSFTESQLEDLEGVLWRSYFA